MPDLVVIPVPDGPPLADLAAALPAEAWPALFDGGPSPDPWARWDMLVAEPVRRLELTTGDDVLVDPACRALARLEQALAQTFGVDHAPGPQDDALPPFRGGAVVTLGYDLVREVERVPARMPRDADLPDLAAGLYPFVLAERRADGRRLVVGRGSEGEARRWWRGLEAAARDVRPPAPLPPAGAPRTSLSRDDYLQAVESIRESIREGDVYQVNLAQRFELTWDGRPADLQRVLRSASSAPFGACLRAPGWAFVSSSPELFLRRRGERVLSRPIKGTRPRGVDVAADARLRAALEASPKERAELSMIVDLVRHDLGRSASLGSVEVALPFETDVWPTVFHRVAQVSARVPSATSTAALIERAWPPASVTGTPKLSALSVIEGLEPVRRHFYTGAFGWIDAGGDCDLSVNIRVATHVAGRLLLPVGGGITLASDPADEYDETLHKAAGLFAALGAELPRTLGAD